MQLRGISLRLLSCLLILLFHNLELKVWIDKITVAGLFPVAAGVTVIPVATQAFSTSPFLFSNELVSGERRRACYVPSLQGGCPTFSLSGDNTGSIYLTLPEALHSWIFSNFSFPSHSVSLHKSAWEGWWRIHPFSFSGSCSLLPLSASIMTSSVRWTAFSFLPSFCETIRTAFEDGETPSTSWRTS